MEGVGVAEMVEGVGMGVGMIVGGVRETPARHQVIGRCDWGIKST